MSFIKGVLDIFWPMISEEEEEEVTQAPLIVLADAAVSRKRGRLNSQEGGGGGGGGGRTMARRSMCKKQETLPLDVSNRGVARMLSMNKARFGIEHERSVLHVFFGKATMSDEEYPLLGDSIEELAEFLSLQRGITNICSLASLYPAGFWNAVYLIGKDVEDIEDQLFSSQ